MDAAVPVDTGLVLDAGRDAAPVAPVDAGLRDAYVGIDARPAPDAGPPCVCTPSSVCVTAACTPEGHCLETPVDDGLVCSEDDVQQLCVAGRCVLRQCGDGYREQGPDPAAEACDDGNDEEGDLCDPACAPVVLTVDADPVDDLDVAPLPGRRGIGVDGQGRALVLWRRDGLSRDAILAQRFDASGVPLGDPLTITDAPAGFHLAPVTTGLTDGWAVAWSASRQGTIDVLVAVVPPVGAMRSARVAHPVRTGRQSDASLAAVGDGFVVGWVDDEPRDGDPAGGVAAQRFDRAGDPIGDAFVLPNDRTGRQRGLQLASAGDEWLAVWEHAEDLGRPSIRARRFRGAIALDEMDLEVSPVGANASVGALSEGRWLVAWENAYENEGDVWARVLDAELSHVPMPLADAEDLREDVVTVARYGDGFAAAWHEGPFESASLAFHGVTPPGYASILEDAFVGGVRATITGDARGLWLAWGAYGPASHGLSLQLFFLPSPPLSESP